VKIASIALVWAVAATAAPPPDVQTVHFTSAPRVNAADKASEPLTGYIARPSGDGPHPAVVAMHGCGGMSARFKQEMLDRWTSWGFVVLVIDSFANHEVKYGCGSSRSKSRADSRHLDAAGGLSYLAKLPTVDSKRVILVGYSQGATAALEAVQTRAASIVGDLHSFAAVVAFYPDCRAYFDPVSAPTLILIGGRDDWNPASRCSELKERHGARGAGVELVVYPEATHAFDWIDLREPRRVEGYLMQYNEAAALDSLQRQIEFVKSQLARQGSLGK
jgi:dienelactone hydrolase